MNRLMLVLLAAIGAAGLAPFARLWQTPPAAAPAPAPDKRPVVEVARPVRKTIHRKLSLPGEVLPNQQAAIHSRVQGYLEEIPVDRGSAVRAGDLLARIGVPELERQLARERAELATCGPAIARAEAEAAWREAVWKRLDAVAARTPNLVSPEALDDARGRAQTARAEVELARSREPGMRAAAEKTRALVDFATLRAPFAGIVTERWADPGDLIQSAATKIVHLVEVDPVRVRIHVPQSDVPAVRAESRARVTVDEIPGKVFEAPVARQFWALNRNTKTMAVEIDLSNPDRAIRPGMFARVAVELDVRPNALVLPATALVTEKKKNSVFVVRDGVARKVSVRLGFDDGIEFDAAEGISDQDFVIVTGKNLVTDGEKVRTRGP